MIIAGLHKDPWHDTGTALIKDIHGTPEFVNLAEERADRIKNSRAFPELSLNACLQHFGIEDINKIDAVVLDYICNNSSWDQDVYGTKTCRKDVFLANIAKEKIHIINHHLAHAYNVFYSSPFPRAAILVVDGRGSEKETQSLFLADGKDITLIESTKEIGIGLLYAAITQKVGFKLLEEGKTMGLAPYGAHIKERVFTFPKDYRGIITSYESMCVEGSYALKGQHPDLITDDQKARGAFDVQQECEEALMHLAQYAKRVTGEQYLCITGGVGLNSVANYEVLKSGLFKDIFINPAASDPGIPLGCALYGYHKLMGKPKTYNGISPYLGPTYSDERIKSAIASFSGYTVVEDPEMRKTAALLAQNKILGLFQGRSEMGPRALGNRSIIMSPLKAENKDILNARVKFREGFRPFAPAILEERKEEYFEIDRPSPYMLLVPPVRKEKQSVIPAVTHVDGTGRLQTISPDFNPGFYSLIKQFGEATGVPVLLNTSFNIAGEPIVETPEDAIRCFLNTNIDVLLIEHYLLIKS